MDQDGKPIQLRGMSTHGIAWFPQYASADAFEFIKEMGGNTVRLAMYTDTENGYLAEPEYNRELLYGAAEAALSLGLYVILDWHILTDGDPLENLEAAVGFFTEAAEKYRHEPRILYEIANEPNGVDWESVREYADLVIQAIRKVNPRAVIIVGTPDFSSSLTAAIRHPLPQENLLYAYHYYAGEKTDYRELELAVSQKFPVFVSEWGIGQDRSKAAALEEGESFAAFLNEHKVSWCAWSFCNKDEVYSLLKPDCFKESGFTMDDLSAVGEVYADAMGGKP